MDVTGLTIPGLARDAAERYQGATAVEDGGTTLTFEGLAEAALAATRAYLAAGVEPGDRVAIWAPNLHEWIPAALGLQGAGGVLVPLNTRYKGTEAGYILRKSRARILCTIGTFLGTDYLAMLRTACGGPEGERPVADLPDLERVVLLRRDAARTDGGGELLAATTDWADFLAGGEAVSEADGLARIEAVRPDDLSDLLFTSGTTGNPKGVRTTHAQNLRAFQAWTEVIGLHADDRYLIVNPFFHAFGYKAGWLSAILRGSTILPHPVFDVPQVLKRIEADRVSMLPGPPALFQMILAHPDLASTDLSSLRLAVTGAASIPVELIEQMRDDLGFETVITGYGLTEACGVATMCRFDDDPETIATTSGRAIPDVEVLCVDESGAEVPRGEPGEVVIRGYNVMQGYFEDPEASSAAIDERGWLHTGDVGVMDERGYLRITDRLKDMFIMGGFNCYPAEIENLITTHPDVVQAAVIGVPDERMGEVGMAFVVPAAGATLIATDLIAWCRENMANFKVPRHVEVVAELPMNATNKITKFVLRDRAREILGQA